MSRGHLVFCLTVLVAAATLTVGLLATRNWLVAWLAGIAFVIAAAITGLIAGLAALLSSRRVAALSIRLAGLFAILALTSMAIMLRIDPEEPPAAGSKEAEIVALVEAFRANHKGRAPCANEFGTLPVSCTLDSCGASMMQFADGKWHDNVPIAHDEYMLTCRGMPGWIYSSKTQTWYPWWD
jgi:hypothetical protein